MRHIPEDELHAYLDQALSRSQCAEIETHLSACSQCHIQRNTVAALRDQTTALLGRLGPRPVIVPPSYQTLRERHGRRLAIAQWRARLQRAGLWAAGVVGAVGAGWTARSILDPHRVPAAPVHAVAPAPAPAAVDPTADLASQATPIPILARGPRFLDSRTAEPRPFEAVVPAPTLHLASAVFPLGAAATTEATPSRPDLHDPFNRIWRQVSWEDALQMAGSALPFIEGMPVPGVLFQPGAPGERPTVIVAQQDPGGEVIQSIEGPVAKVSELLQHQTTPDVHTSDATRTPPDYVEGVSGMRRALRILTVTGRLSVDSLNALARIATIR